MHFAFDPRTELLRENLLDLMWSHIHAAEPVFRKQLGALDDRWAWDSVPVLGDLRAEARRRGLWNLFLPGEQGGGLTHLQYAPLAEITGHSPELAPAVLNCAAPDTGTMDVLSRFGTEAQRKEWLEPLLAGEIRSAFATTEPDATSSDPTHIATSIVPDGGCTSQGEASGGDYVINGRTRWITGALNPNARVFLVLGRTDPDAERHRRHSLILVPRDTPGVEIRRVVEVFGYEGQEHGGHAELVFHDVRVPASHRIGEEGDGFAITHARSGPERIHHCMRSIGVAERAVELMCARVEERVAFGKPPTGQGVIHDWIAESRLRIEQLRLLVLKCAWLMDTVGDKGAHAEIQAIRIATPRTVRWILDKAIRTHGAEGLSPDFPLARAYAGIHALRFADGPDEVHKDALARAELSRRAATGDGRTVGADPSRPLGPRQRVRRAPSLPDRIGLTP